MWNDLWQKEARHSVEWKRPPVKAFRVISVKAYHFSGLFTGVDSSWISMSSAGLMSQAFCYGFHHLLGHCKRSNYRQTPPHSLGIPFQEASQKLANGTGRGANCRQLGPSVPAPPRSQVCSQHAWTGDPVPPPNPPLPYTLFSLITFDHLMHRLIARPARGFQLPS